MDGVSGCLSLFFKCQCSLFGTDSDDRSIVYALLCYLAFYFQKYSFIDSLFSEGRRYVAFNSNNRFDLTAETKQRILVLKPLLKCSFFVALATLCRYEAWPIFVFLILLGLVYLTGRKDLDRTEMLIPPRARMKLRSGFLLCTLVSTSGIIVWISYNSIYYANPVEFVVSPYYSAISQAIEGQNSEASFLQPLNVAYIYGTGCVGFFWARYDVRSYRGLCSS